MNSFIFRSFLTQVNDKIVSKRKIEAVKGFQKYYNVKFSQNVGDGERRVRGRIVVVNNLRVVSTPQFDITF